MSTPHDEHRIGLTGGIILIVLTLSAGISVFTIMQRQSKSILSKSLGVALQNKISLFKHQIKKGLSVSQTAAMYLSLAQDLEWTKTPQGKNEQLNRLSQISRALLQNSFSGIVIHDNTANKIVDEGHITQNPALMVQLKTEKDIRAFLLWKGQFLLRIIIDIKNQAGQHIGNIITDSSDHAIVAASIAMANSLKIDIIAEGVETEEHLNLLIQQGCNRYQGYFFSKPFPASEIKNKFKKTPHSSTPKMAFCLSYLKS